jgi:hypothetical protein
VPLGSGGVGEVPAKAELAAGRGVGTGTVGSAEHPASTTTMTNPTGHNRAMAPRVGADPSSSTAQPSSLA